MEGVSIPELELLENTEETETPAQVVLDAEQYQAIVGVLESTNYELQKSNERLQSVWFLLAIMVLFEAKRIVNGVGQKLRKVRK